MNGFRRIGKRGDSRRADSRERPAPQARYVAGFFIAYGADMALTLAQFIDQMNAALPSIRRHPLKGIVPQASRYDGHNCHLVVDTDCRELDHEACPQALHATLPEEA